ncbi:cytochrome c [uncultured Jannaschia sp.]|uniref:c-type cytochrome n=1 Tax=uncultured Jannaschia sp. TaxID=293347 RepID=UPI002612B6F8|nr:cytochrome c [uncultured Jannaschia sp.]
MSVGRALVLLLALAACRDDMGEQNKDVAYDPSGVWSDGASTRPRVAGTVTRDAPLRVIALAEPPEVTPALLARGRERFEIFCAPCHGFDGTGDGRVVQRGFPRPPSYLSERLRAAPAAHFLSIIADGFGVMYPYGDRVEPADRWAIVAYIRALQLAGGDAPQPDPARAAVPVETPFPPADEAPE